MKGYRYVQSFIDGGGRVRNYFRRQGYPRIALPDQIAGPEFVISYQAALSAPRNVPLSSLLGGTERSGAKPLIGVYLLMLKGKVTYIGSSLNMPWRLPNIRPMAVHLIRRSISLRQLENGKHWKAY